MIVLGCGIGGRSDGFKKDVMSGRMEFTQTRQRVKEVY